MSRDAFYSSFQHKSIYVTKVTFEKWCKKKTQYGYSFKTNSQFADFLLLKLDESVRREVANGIVHHNQQKDEETKTENVPTLQEGHGCSSKENEIEPCSNEFVRPETTGHNNNLSNTDDQRKRTLPNSNDVSPSNISISSAANNHQYSSYVRWMKERTTTSSLQREQSSSIEGQTCNSQKETTSAEEEMTTVLQDKHDVPSKEKTTSPQEGQCSSLQKEKEKPKYKRTKRSYQKSRNNLIQIQERTIALLKEIVNPSRTDETSSSMKTHRKMSGEVHRNERLNNLLKERINSLQREASEALQKGSTNTIDNENSCQELPSYSSQIDQTNALHEENIKGPLKRRHRSLEQERNKDPLEKQNKNPIKKSKAIHKQKERPVQKILPKEKTLRQIQYPSYVESKSQLISNSNLPICEGLIHSSDIKIEPTNEPALNRMGEIISTISLKKEINSPPLIEQGDQMTSVFSIKIEEPYMLSNPTDSGNLDQTPSDNGITSDKQTTSISQASIRRLEHLTNQIKPWEPTVTNQTKFCEQMQPEMQYFSSNLQTCRVPGSQNSRIEKDCESIMDQLIKIEPQE